MRHEVLTLRTDSGGAVSVRSGPLDGDLSALRLLIGTLAAGAVDLTVTDEASGTVVLSASDIAGDASYFPRLPANRPSDGAAIADSYVSVPVAGVLRADVAGGGADKTGYLVVFVGDEE